MKRTTKKVADQIENKKPRKPPVAERHSLLPTGCTLLNLALSDCGQGGFAAGKIANIIGDESSGKSFIALTMLAELARTSTFADYRLIYDDAEAANSFDMNYLFGKGISKRIEAPAYDGKESVFSDTVERFNLHIHDLLDEEEQFVYV